MLPEQEVSKMKSIVTEANMKDAQKMTTIFNMLSDNDKTKAMVYISALRDKEVADEVEKVKT